MNLVESILTGDNVESKRLFEEHMRGLVERKLYEVKRSIDITEAVLGINDDSPARRAQAKYRKENPAMSFYGTPDNPRAKKPDHRDEKTQRGSITKHGLKMRRKAGYLSAHQALNSSEFIKRVKMYKKTGEVPDPHKTPWTGNLDETLRGKNSDEAGWASKFNQSVSGLESPTRPAKGAFGVGAASKGNTSKPAMDMDKLQNYGNRNAKTSIDGTKNKNRNKRVDGYSSKVFSRGEIDRGDQHQSDASTYDSDKQTAYNLQRAGDKEAVGKFKKAYRTHRFKLAARGAIGVASAGLGRVRDEIASYSNLNEGDQ